MDSKDNKPGNYTSQMKLLLLGDQAVGKSSIMIRYTDDKFSLNMMGTAGIDLKRKSVTIGTDLIKVMIYDTAGHDRFRQITKVQYKGAKGVVLVYDVTDRKSFESVSSWMDHIKENADDEVKILLVGNKIDIVNRQVTTSEGEALATKYDVPFIETSALNGDGIETAFSKLINAVHERDSTNTSVAVKTIAEKPKKKEKNRCCY